MPSGKRLVMPVDAVRSGVNKDAEFGIAGRFWNARIRFYTNEGDEFFMRIEHGNVTGFEEGTDGYQSSTIHIGGPRDTWHEVLKLEPKRLYHDFFPAMVHHGMTLGGDLSSLYAYYSALQRILAVMRREVSRTRK